MKTMEKFQRIGSVAVAAAVLAVLLVIPAAAGEYDAALKGVKGFDAVYEVSQGNPKVANAVFWAVKNSYEEEAVAKLFTNGIFRGHPAKPYYENTSGVGLLLFALLELDAPDEDLGGAF